MRLFVAVTQTVCSTSASGLVHATDPLTIIGGRNRRPRKTVDTACGRKRARLLVHGSRTTTGEDVVVAALWPPPVAKHPRCAECMAATGARRPDPSWRLLREDA